MRIAIPLAEGKLAVHFGHCATFAMLDIDKAQGIILKREDVPAPPHTPGLLPPWMAERGVSLIIAGGMGRRAIELFVDHRIQVILGVPSDTPEKLASDYLTGKLEIGMNPCDH